MNINRTLLEAIDSFGFKYSCYTREVEPFLVGKLDFLDRRNTAEKIIEDILREHGKQDLIGCLAELAKVEAGIRELDPRARDHVVHALLTFILGIYIAETYLNNNQKGERINSFQWKLSGLLHDVGYPIEISTRIMRPFENTLNRLRRRFGASRSVRFQTVPNHLSLLSNNLDGLDLVQNQLGKWGLQIDAHREYASMIENGSVCHGIIGSLAILNIVDAMYQQYNPGRLYKKVLSAQNNLDWDQSFFEKDIVPACSAVFIHNLSARSFELSKVSLQKAPLPFLLILADSLQSWERPSYENPKGLASNLFDISVSNGNLHFYAEIPKPDKDKIIEELKSTLDIEHMIDISANGSINLRAGGFELLLED